MAVPSAGQLYNQLQGINQQLGTYNLGAAPGQIQTAIGNAVNNFRPQYQELANAQNAAYGLPGQVYNEFQNMQNTGAFQNPGISGTQFTGLNPLQVLGVGMGRIGNQFSIADALSGGLDFQKARLEDIIKSVGNQYQTGYNQTLDSYNRLLPLYQQQAQAEENARNRAASSAASGMNLKALMDAINGTGTGGHELLTSGANQFARNSLSALSQPKTQPSWASSLSTLGGKNPYSSVLSNLGGQNSYLGNMAGSMRF
jgi:hypothetical protein